jgi:hypothetical protein
MLMAGATAVGVGSALQGDGEATPSACIMGEIASPHASRGAEALAELQGVRPWLSPASTRPTRVVAAPSPKVRLGVTLIGWMHALPAQPGQFVMAWLPGIEERPLYHHG